MDLNMDKLPENMRLYSLKQAAEILGASTRTLMRYFADGRLAGQKVGGRWKVSQAAIAEFLGHAKTKPENSNVQ